MSASAHDALRQLVAEPATRARLAAYLRHRGIDRDRDDMVQTILCDALAVEAVPVEPADVPRWITGIARNKVADEHRRRGRWRWEELGESAGYPQPEARDLLRRVHAELVEPEERRALSYILREYAGETLQDIAAELGIEPHTLRQRICRLRRLLRTRYLVPLLLLLAGAGALGFHAQSATGEGAVAASLVRVTDGTWQVVGGPERYRGLLVSIDGDSALVRNSAGLTLASVHIRRGPNPRHVELLARGARWQAEVEHNGAERITLRAAGVRVTLERLP